MIEIIMIISGLVAIVGIFVLEWYILTALDEINSRNGRH